MNCRQATGMGSRERCLGHDEITDHEDRRLRCRENVCLSKEVKEARGWGVGRTLK